MATRSIVPRADGEGSLGTETKQWGDVQTKKLNGIDVDNITELAQMLNLKLSIADAPAVCTPFGFPSATYVNIGITASTTEYTPPANGYVCITALSTNSVGFIELMQTKSVQICIGPYGIVGMGMYIILPVRSGTRCIIVYQNVNNVVANFIYAQGEVPE